MTRYLYPQNLKAKVNLWLWGMRDFILLIIGALISVVVLIRFGWILPLALTACMAFLTIRKDEMTILGYCKYAMRYLIGEQQQYKWR